MMKYLLVNIEAFQKGELPQDVVDFIEYHGTDVFIVLDESSKIKTNRACKEDRKSKRTRAIQLLNTTGERCIMTGTLMSKSPVNVYDQMGFLKKNYFEESIFEFESKYVITNKINIGKGVKAIISRKMWENLHKSLNRPMSEAQLQGVIDSLNTKFSISEKKLRFIKDHKKYTPHIHLKDLYERIKDDIMVVKKKDVLGMPDKVYETIKVEPTPEMLKHYKLLLSDDYLKDFGDEDEPVLLKGIAKFHRFQDVCNGYIPIPYEDEDGKICYRLERQKENPKINAILDKLDSIDLSTEQVIVWSNRKLFLHDIKDALEKEDISTAIYDGDTTDKEKGDIERSFVSRDLRVILMNQGSGAYGLDWLKKANIEMFASNDYSAEKREQAEDRIHRGTEMASKVYIDIVIEGTVDENIVLSLRMGQDLIHSGKTDTEVYGLFHSTSSTAMTIKPSKNKKTSWVHQDIAVERFKNKKYFGLIFDCGTGKTRTAIRIAEEKGKPTIVIMPKNIRSQWREAIEEHCTKESIIFTSKITKSSIEDFLEA